MPLIDVTRVLSSPMVASQKFTVVRREEVMLDSGRSQLKESRFEASGSIVPTGDNSLVREEAFSQQLNSVKVITTFRLRGASHDAVDKKFQADIIMSPVGTFIVRVVNDYTQFGAGMVEADCVSHDYQSSAPQ